MGLSTNTDRGGSGRTWEPASVGKMFSRIGACGVSFGRGVFRFHDADSAPPAQQAVMTAFPALASRADVIAFDWLGRQYAVVSGAGEDGGDEIVLLDPSGMTEQGLVAPTEFLEALQVPLFLDVVEATLFDTWRASAASFGLAFERCVAMTVPNFLGGALDISNLAESDIDVYWSVCTQLWQQTADLDPGTAVDGLRVDP